MTHFEKLCICLDLIEPKAAHYLRRSKHIRELIPEKREMSLMSMFTWSLTPQGHTFWCDLHWMLQQNNLLRLNDLTLEEIFRRLHGTADS